MAMRKKTTTMTTTSNVHYTYNFNAFCFFRGKSAAAVDDMSAITDGSSSKPKGGKGKKGIQSPCIFGLLCFSVAYMF